MRRERGIYGEKVGVMIRSFNCHSEVPPNFPKLMRNRSENQLQLSITINSHRGKSEDHQSVTHLLKIWGHLDNLHGNLTNSQQ